MCMILSQTTLSANIEFFEVSQKEQSKASRNKFLPKEVGILDEFQGKDGSKILASSHN